MKVRSDSCDTLPPLTAPWSLHKVCASVLSLRCLFFMLQCLDVTEWFMTLCQMTELSLRSLTWFPPRCINISSSFSASLFPVWMRKRVVSKGSKIIQLLGVHEEVFLWFFQIQTEGKDKLFSSGAVGTMQVRSDGATSSHQLYLAVCTLIVATVWAVYSELFLS